MLGETSQWYGVAVDIVYGYDIPTTDNDIIIKIYMHFKPMKWSRL